MNKLKVGDIIYIAETDEIVEVAEIGEFCRYYKFNETFEFTIIIHEHMNLGFTIKLEL